MRIGFTGTRRGMTFAQRATVKDLVIKAMQRIDADTAAHGMCEGADEQFHQLCAVRGLHMVGFPGVTVTGQPYLRSTVKCDEVREEQPFLERNRNIVDFVDVMIACPGEKTEQWAGSGTWATIRYMKQSENVFYFIVWPDGTVTKSGDA